MNLDTQLQELGVMPRKEAAALLKEALARISNPQPNGNGGPIQMAGIYWRLARVLYDFADARLAKLEGPDQAEHVRSAHGCLRKWIPLAEREPHHDGWVLLRHQCNCCDKATISIARLAHQNDGTRQWIYKHPTDDNCVLVVEGWKDSWQPVSFSQELPQAKLQ